MVRARVSLGGLTAGDCLLIEDLDLIEEVVLLRDRELVVLRPRDAESMIDEEAFASEERMPYWAELWPSGVALARAVSGAAMGGRRIVEIGCGGLALPSIAASLAGASVLATDWAPEALELASGNAERNGTSVDTAEVAWADAEDLVARGPFDLVLGADVLYESRNVDALLELLPRLTDEVWLADPRRPAAEMFLEWADERWEGWERHETTDPAVPNVVIHRMNRGRG